MTTIAAARVLTPGGFTGPAEVVVDDGRVVAVGRLRGPAPERLLAPGFVDLQVNGADEVDVATAEAAAWGHLDDALVASGVTAWCPTVTSRPPTDYGEVLARIGEAAAARTGDPRRDPVPAPAVLGAHLEGPFLTRAGAHGPDALEAAAAQGPDGMARWLASLPPLVRLVTLAPELDGALAAIAAATERGITVALGHSAADLPTATAAAGAGARLVTHLFNAMAPLHHRAPGLVGAGLVDDRLTATVIADGEHLDPSMIRLAFRAKGAARVALVTDRVAGPHRRPDGALAGSALTMDRAVANAVAAGVELADALAAAATTPATALRLADRGRIEPGARADLVALDHQLAVTGVWIAGEQVR